MIKYQNCKFCGQICFEQHNLDYSDAFAYNMKILSDIYTHKSAEQIEIIMQRNISSIPELLETTGMPTGYSSLIIMPPKCTAHELVAASRMGYVCTVRYILHQADRAFKASDLDEALQATVIDQRSQFSSEWGGSSACQMIVQYLVQAGANVCSIHQSGRTLLHNASSRSDASLIQLLLDNGAMRDINKRACDGRTPLDYAKSWDRRAVAQLLESVGAEATRDFTGATHPSSASSREGTSSIKLSTRASTGGWLSKLELLPAKGWEKCMVLLLELPILCFLLKETTSNAGGGTVSETVVGVADDVAVKVVTLAGEQVELSVGAGCSIMDVKRELQKVTGQHKQLLQLYHSKLDNIQSCESTPEDQGEILVQEEGGGPELQDMITLDTLPSKDFVLVVQGGMPHPGVWTRPRGGSGWANQWSCCGNRDGDSGFCCACGIARHYYNTRCSHGLLLETETNQPLSLVFQKTQQEHGS
jgi:hypothetical protein